MFDYKRLQINEAMSNYQECLHGDSLRSCLFKNIMLPEKSFVVFVRFVDGFVHYRNPRRD